MDKIEAQYSARLSKGIKIYNMNNKTRNQHYVPCFYLNGFANDKKFWAYDFSKCRMIPNMVDIYSQCVKAYFYGEDGIWEQRLSNMEREWAIVLKKVVGGRKLMSNEVILLKRFLLFQKLRTSSTANYLQNDRESILLEWAKSVYISKGWVFGEEAKKFCRDRAKEKVTPAENVELADQLYSYIDDLNTLIVHYNTTRKLLVSDSPVIALNAFLKCYGFGLNNIGIAFIMPLSPEYLLIVYDAKIYRDNSDNIYQESTNEEDVETINKYLLINAERMVYSNDKSSFELVTQEIYDYRDQEYNRNQVQFLGPEGTNRLMINNAHGTNYYFKLSFLKLPREYSRIPFVCREMIPRTFESGWDIKLAKKYKVLSATICNDKINEKINKYKISRTELKLGCRWMEKLARIYWER